MNKLQLKKKKLKTNSNSHKIDFGFDFISTENKGILESKTKLIKTGIYIPLPQKTVTQTKSRSTVINASDNIENEYSGKIAQMIAYSFLNS